MKIEWTLAVDASVLCLLLAAATLARLRLGILQRSLIPNSIVAGLLGFALNGEMLGLLPVDPGRYGTYVYHLLAVAFVAIGLQGAGGGRAGRGALFVGFALSFGYALQALLGVGIALALMYTVVPDLFPTYGFMLLLGFGQGPGQAYALGHAWEAAGFRDGGSVGLTFAALGYLWACFVGVWLVRRAMHRAGGGASGPADDAVARGVIDDPARRPAAGAMSTAPEAVDGLAFHVALVGCVYGATHLLLLGAEALLRGFAPESPAVSQAIVTLWGLHFIFAALMAMAARAVLVRCRLAHLVDAGLMNRVAGTAVDFMVVAALASISLAVVLAHWLPIVLITVPGGLATAWFVCRFVARHAPGHRVENLATIYGTLTGTLATGLGLARICDPHFRTPAAQDLVLGCGIATPLSAPLMALMVLPLLGLGAAQPSLYHLGTLALLAIYLTALGLVWRCLRRRDACVPELLAEATGDERH